MLLVALTLSLCLARDDRVPLLVGVSSLSHDRGELLVVRAEAVVHRAQPLLGPRLDLREERGIGRAHVAAKSRRPALAMSRSRASPTTSVPTDEVRRATQ